MNRTKFLPLLGLVAVVTVSFFLISADHLDSTDVQGQPTDIADFYAFTGENSNNLVFAVTIQGLLVPGIDTENATFDEDVLVEINIDNNNDLVEDLVIQAIARQDTMYFFGPTGPNNTGLESTVVTSAPRSQVQISTVEDIFTSENNGMKFYAGPRDDAFFFDQENFNAIVDGSSDSFAEEGTDFYANKNALAVVVEVPKAMLGTGQTGVNPFSPDVPMYNVWVETKRKQ